MTAATDIHGDEWARGLPHDHAVNVVAGGPPPWLRTALQQALENDLGRYPDEAAAKHAVAARHGRDPDEVVLLNGASHGFRLVADVLAPERPAIVHPQFTEPDRVLPHARHVILDEPWHLDPSRVPTNADLVVVGNPTNPTGVLHPPAAIEELARPGRAVLVDEAFMDFVGDDAQASLAHSDQVIVLRSLTKILGVPGLRVGYLLAPLALARALNDRRQAWPVNALALAAAQAAAEHPHAIDQIAAQAREDRAALAVALCPHVTTVHDGAANFLLVEARADLAHVLRDDHGIAVRPAGTFPGLSPNHLRITARGGAADHRLVAAIAGSGPASR